MYQQEARAPIPTIGILSNDDERLHKVIMTNLKKDTTQEELKSFLVEKTGIAECNIISIEIREPYPTPYNKDKTTMLADVVFDSTRSTDQCISNLYKHADKERQLKENTMNMRRVIPDFIKKNKRMKDSMMEKTKKLFVASLPKEGYNEELLTEELTKHIGSLADSEETQILGTIESYQVIMDKEPMTGARLTTPKGYAFIHVSSEHLADKLAIQCGGGFEIGGRRIDFKKKVDGEGGGARGFRGAMRGRGGFGARGGRGGFAAQQQWGAYPPQQAYAGWEYPPQQAYGGYGQQGYGGYAQQQGYGGYYGE